mmetsp:Transcript_5155/g.6582  ORF Transcript_5155/g.6582 Transcript_5155/m.6582 type:complete len:320 (+) Transcript_5155:174-1133(+)
MRRVEAAVGARGQRRSGRAVGLAVVDAPHGVAAHHFALHERALRLRFRGLRGGLRRPVAVAHLPDVQAVLRGPEAEALELADPGDVGFADVAEPHGSQRHAQRELADQLPAQTSGLQLHLRPLDARGVRGQRHVRVAEHAPDSCAEVLPQLHADDGAALVAGHEAAACLLEVGRHLPRAVDALHEAQRLAVRPAGAVRLRAGRVAAVLDADAHVPAREVVGERGPVDVHEDDRDELVVIPLGDDQVVERAETALRPLLAVLRQRAQQLRAADHRDAHGRQSERDLHGPRYRIAGGGGGARRAVACNNKRAWSPLNKFKA